MRLYAITNKRDSLYKIKKMFIENGKSVENHEKAWLLLSFFVVLWFTFHSVFCKCVFCKSVFCKSVVSTTMSGVSMSGASRCDDGRRDVSRFDDGRRDVSRYDDGRCDDGKRDDGSNDDGRLTGLLQYFRPG